MANNPSHKMILATTLACGMFLAGTAQTAPPPPAAPKPPAKIENFEDAQKAIERAQAELAKSLKDLKVPVPPLPDVAEMNNMIRQLEQATAANIEATAQLSEAKRAEIKKELAVALQNAQEAIQHMRDSKDLQIHNATLQQKVAAEMKKAQEHMAAAATEMRQFEAFVNTLIADGLIQKDAYRVEEKAGKLLLDGKEQPSAVYEKHRSFLNKHKGLKITKDINGLQIKKEQQVWQ
ncbi:hypothetical protein [Pseudocnuella soli]|uniref:hypothetical protein n=1 Tax=Pseudocnuella soli TaxID=2502779 RepID=UPI00104C06F5|nr:hypothetical protein [Pseudocnuella soli]